MYTKNIRINFLKTAVLKEGSMKYSQGSAFKKNKNKKPSKPSGLINQLESNNNFNKAYVQSMKGLRMNVWLK